MAKSARRLDVDRPYAAVGPRSGSEKTNFAGSGLRAWQGSEATEGRVPAGRVGAAPFPGVYAASCSRLALIAASFWCQSLSASFLSGQ